MEPFLLFFLFLFLTIAEDCIDKLSLSMLNSSISSCLSLIDRGLQSSLPSSRCYRSLRRIAPRILEILSRKNGEGANDTKMQQNGKDDVNGEVEDEKIRNEVDEQEFTPRNHSKGSLAEKVRLCHTFQLFFSYFYFSFRLIFADPFVYHELNRPRGAPPRHDSRPPNRECIPAARIKIIRGTSGEFGDRRKGKNRHRTSKKSRTDGV